MKNVSNYKNDPDTKKKIRITKKKQQKKILENFLFFLGFELRPEDFTIGDADQLAYALSLFVSYLLTIYTSFF